MVLNDSWETAYVGTPHFYRDKDGGIFGAFALTEGTLTVLPKNPCSMYRVNGAQVGKWRLMLVSTTKDNIIGEQEYYSAVERLVEYISAEMDNRILIRGLSLAEMYEILNIQ